MKRTKIFVLLCAFILALCTGAWAENEIIDLTSATSKPIPATLHDTATENSIADADLYTADTYNLDFEATDASTGNITLHANHLMYHQNGDTSPSKGYWIGVAIPVINEVTKASYKFGKGAVPLEENKELKDLTYTELPESEKVSINGSTEKYYAFYFDIKEATEGYIALKYEAETDKVQYVLYNVTFDVVREVTLAGDTITIDPTEITYGNALSSITIKSDGITAKLGDDDFTAYTLNWENPETVPAVSDSETTEYGVIFVATETGKYGSNKTWNVKVKVNPAAAALSEAPKEKDSLTYDNTDQELITAGTATNAKLEYLKEYKTKSATAPTDGWVTDVPTGKEAGTYYVWYKVVADTNYTYSDTEAKCLTVDIAQATNSVTTIPQPKTLSESSEAQELVSEGAAKFGKLSYAVTTTNTAPDASVYTTTIPTGKEAGTYYVWYKVDGTDNYDGVAAASVTVTISGSAPAAKPELTLSLTVASSDLKAGTVGETYTEDLTKHITVTTNGSYTWSATGLPAGLSASTAGAITGTPTASADKKAVTVTVKATSADTEPTLLDKTATLYITINAKTVVPVDPASGDVTSGDVKSQDVKPDEPVKSDDVNPVVPTTSDDEAVKEIENILSGDATLNKEDVEKVISNLENLSNDVALNSTEADNLVKNILSQDSALSLSDQQVEAVAKALVSNDGTITAEAMTTLTNSLAKSDTTTGETTLTAEALTGNSTAAKIAVQALASSVENSENKELNLETVPLTSLSGIGKLLDSVVAGSSSTTSTSELTLDLGKVETLKTVDNLSGVAVKEIKLENNTSVTDVKLDGASIDKVSMKSSAVKEVKLDANSKVAEIDASGADLTSIDLASNDNIVTLNISETKVSELNAAGCAGLKDLSAEATSEGAGELREVNLEGCTSLEKLSLSNNKLLGVKKPSGFTTPSGFTFKARGQKRTAETKFSVGMNFFEFIFNLWKATLSTEDAADKTYETASADAPVNFSDIVSVKADGNNVSFDADGKLSAGSAAPTTSFSYELDPFGLIDTSVEGGSVKAAAEDDGMEVTISGEGEESNGTSGSGGGCDTGLFGFSVLSALAVFITRRQRR